MPIDNVTCINIGRGNCIECMSLSYKVGIISLVILVHRSLSPIEHDFSKQAFGQELKVITYDMMLLSKYDLVHDSEATNHIRKCNKAKLGRCTVGEEQAGVPKNVTHVPAIRTYP